MSAVAPTLVSRMSQCCVPSQQQMMLRCSYRFRCTNLPFPERRNLTRPRRVTSGLSTCVISANCGTASSILTTRRNNGGAFVSSLRTPSSVCGSICICRGRVCANVCSIMFQFPPGQPSRVSGSKAPGRIRGGGIADL